MSKRNIMVIQQNVPMCPFCSALMWNMFYKNKLRYICRDCNNILTVVKNGQAENELIVSDVEGDLDDEEEMEL